ncbi:MAG: hypothetical protein IJN75_03950 [Clostridia bacterium]|nr:hypothetical protein [Clostridia bacterium]
MNSKRILKLVLFPPISVMLLILPVAAALLVYSLVYRSDGSPIAIASYVLAFYTLIVWCMRLPYLIKRIEKLKSENRFLKRWRTDARFRVNLSLFGTLLFNVAYALLQLGMGITHKSFWFCSLAGYYFTLALMRFFLVRYTRKHAAREKMLVEHRKYRNCGIIFLAMNLALSLMIFFMVYWNRTFHHHEITTIALAAYTFTSFTFAVINIVKYRKYNSPVYSASRTISLASACVSMLTLEATMLTTFGKETMSLFERRLLLGISGGVISAFVIAMAIYMIVRGTKEIKLIGDKNGK